ncbi:MAG: deoxyguanosinetriphosphate triphosphohydrolase, partial [Alphaproteobacteria bacterium]|nr:deoxyguanosinetriphosphate triphosphohydrolase [Alphaproteobacteria bacterium]
MTVKPKTYGPSLAKFACQPGHSRGRLFEEAPGATRTEYQRDRDRIIHSAAFRRLKHKTQVFVYHVGDYYRTRLTHSLEVSQIARSIARYLGLNEDLAEALALAHDLGHTPFGHSGEEALDAAMAEFGGFDHNAQTLKILTRLEQRYAAFDGLNLTWETLEGVVKHNGPLKGANASKDRAAVPQVIEDFDRTFPLDLDTFASAEAQVAALADDIAYNNHDIDDGLRAGLIAIEDLHDVPLVGPVFAEVGNRWPDLARHRLIHEAVRRLINAMVTDLISESSARLEAAAPGSPDEIRALDHPV